jgi:hypothetical protein
MSDTWFAETESTIFTILQYLLTEKTDAPYPTLNCTTSNQNDSVSGVGKFPTLYVHELPPVEMGNDLVNESVNAIRATFELQIFSNKSEQECRKIMNACILEMKKLRFTISMFPDPQVSSGVYYCIARFTRVIGSGDTDIVQN